MKLSTIGAIATVTIAAGSASASVVFIGYGIATPTGEKLITDFSSSAGLSGSGVLFTGSQAGVSAAPAFSAKTVDIAQYMSVGLGASETVVLPSSSEISLYVGSLDGYNSVSFGGPGGAAYTFGGSDLGAVSGAYNGDQKAINTNGRFVFSFAAPVTSVTLSSSGNAFEVASIAGVASGPAIGAVPEPASWALMLIGVGGAGLALRARRRGATLASGGAV